MPELNPHIDKFFKTVNALSRSLFEQTGELRLAMCFMLVGESEIIQIPIPMAGNNQGKDIISFVLKTAAGHLKPSALTFVSECWMVSQKADGMNKDEALKKFSGRDLSQEPDREECIMLVNETKIASSIVSIPIIRGENGRITLGEERVGKDMTGRFANFLHDYGTKMN